MDKANVRKKRLVQWAICIVLAVLFILSENLYNYYKEREFFTVCAPADMEGAFKAALKMADIDWDYELVMTDNPTNANVVIDYAKENNDSFMKIAFSPFAVAYCNDSYYAKTLLKSDFLQSSPYEDSYFEINLSEVIDIILENGDWEDYGIKGFDKVKVIYPDPSSIYWHDFYNLMLIAANEGKYPITESEYENASKVLSRFFESENTEACINYKEKILSKGGFTQDILYIGTEKYLSSIATSLGESARFIYPTETVYFNYYMKTDEVGNKILPTLNKENNASYMADFYYYLNENLYRSMDYLAINEDLRIISDERDVYNIVNIPEDVEWKKESNN